MKEAEGSLVAVSDVDPGVKKRNNGFFGMETYEVVAWVFVLLFQQRHL